MYEGPTYNPTRRRAAEPCRSCAPGCPCGLLPSTWVGALLTSARVPGPECGLAAGLLFL